MQTASSPGGRSGPTFIEAARRAQIVRCAIDVLAELGYTNASLTQIAKRAGVSKSVISYHFAGKDELLDQVVIEVGQTVATALDPRVEAAPTASAKLHAYIEGMLEFARTHRAHMMALTEVVLNARTDDGKLRYDPTGYETLYTAIETILRYGQETGELRRFHTRAMAVAVQGAVDGVIGQLSVYPDLDTTLYATELTALFDLATRQD